MDAGRYSFTEVLDVILSSPDVVRGHWKSLVVAHVAVCYALVQGESEVRSTQKSHRYAVAINCLQTVQWHSPATINQSINQSNDYVIFISKLHNSDEL